VLWLIYSPNGYLFLPPSLLKTFSISPFQGQYSNIAVRINITPINPTIQRKIPSMKKAKIIKMIPMIERKIASGLLTFFVLTMGSIFFSPYPFLKQNPIPFSEMGSQFISRPHTHLWG
jgi:hypothetical protein